MRIQILIWRFKGLIMYNFILEWFIYFDRLAIQSICKHQEEVKQKLFYLQYLFIYLSGFMKKVPTKISGAF